MDTRTAFRQSARRTPEAVALRTLDDEAFTYETLDRRTDALAAALNRQLGDRRSASLLGNTQAAVELFLAAAKRGVANVPLNTRATAKEAAFMVENGDAACLFVDGANAEMGAAVVETTGVAPIAVGDATGAGLDGPSYEPLLDEAPRETLESRGDEVAIFHTSGTTGEPKGVLVDGERSWLAHVQAVMEHGTTPNDVALVTTPLFHAVTPVSWVGPHLVAGATVVPQPAFDPADALDAVEALGVTAVFGVPTQLGALAEAQADAPRDLSSLRTVRTGGAPLPPETVSAVHRELDAPLHNTYGATEGVANITHAWPERQHDQPGTIGRAGFHWEVRVVEAASPGEPPAVDATVGRGATGELLARGPCVVDGYLDRPEAEADLFVEGWFRTGDVVRVAENGALFVIDRTDNMIVTGGENVYPQEVEAALADHAAVTDVAVIGVPDETWGRAVKAVLATADGTIPDDIDDFCRAHEGLADYKRPRHYAATEDLPRSPIGKLRRGLIQEEFGDAN